MYEQIPGTTIPAPKTTLSSLSPLPRPVLDEMCLPPNCCQRPFSAPVQPPTTGLEENERILQTFMYVFRE